MIPQEELDRALARWKARKLGQEGSVESNQDSASLPVDPGAIVHEEEPTRVAAAHYHSEVETPPAEVTLGEDDFEDHTHRRR